MLPLARCQHARAAIGELDFIPIVQALAKIDDRGWVCVEVFDDTPGVEPLAREHCMQRCLARLSG